MTHCVETRRIRKMYSFPLTPAVRMKEHASLLDEEGGEMRATMIDRGGLRLACALAMMAVLAVAEQALALPDLLFSISASGQTICDSDCTTCTIGSGECIGVDDEDLIRCRPLTTTLPIDACDWEPFFNGGAPSIDLTSQMFAVDVVPNGHLVFRSGGDRTLPDLSQIKARDIGLFVPNDVGQPYSGGGAYTEGVFKLYLDGDATQASTGAKPWDAVEVLTDGSCEDGITLLGQHTCDLIGSLAGSGTIGGFNFRDEDLLRCRPIANSGGGAVTACDYAMFWEADQVNGGAGFTGNFHSLELTDFDGSTMTGTMLFRGPGDPDLPAHDQARDLLRYTGTFGNGMCTGGALCANDVDCPGGETCDTGTCTLTPDACASDGDCAGSGNDCNRVRTPVGVFDLYFDGNAAGLAGQAIQAFAVLEDDDGDQVPDGLDNCPDDVNPPSICSDGATPCTTSANCLPGDLCVQADADGDGVGDVCDQCAGRDDAVCVCGDGVPDFPSEGCDLGPDNGQLGSPCSAACVVLGTCTGGGPCESSDDCPSGQGCCGDGLVDTPEQCDDGNGNPFDDCDNTCALTPQGIPVLGCEDVFGPLMSPGFVKKAIFKDTAIVVEPGFDKWKSKGDFNLATGDSIDPAAQTVRLVLNQGTAPALYDATLPPGSFVTGGSLTKPKWKFKDKEGDLPTALGWRKAKLRLIANKVKNVVAGQGVAMALDTTPPVRVRQTLRIGDSCSTSVMECLPKSSGLSFKCRSAVFGSASGAFLDP